MRRLLAVALVVAAVWGANLVLPAGNDEAQLRTLTRIAADGANAVTVPGITQSQPQTAVSTSSADAFAPVASTEPSLNRAELIERMQEQLKRVGCYKGRIDGKWNNPTQRALARFDDRLGVRPVLDQPPAAALPALLSYGDRACGAPCPIATHPDNNGNCAAPQTTVVASAAPSVMQPIADAKVMSSAQDTAAQNAVEPASMPATQPAANAEKPPAFAPAPAIAAAVPSIRLIPLASYAATSKALPAPQEQVAAAQAHSTIDAPPAPEQDSAAASDRTVFAAPVPAATVSAPASIAQSSEQTASAGNQPAARMALLTPAPQASPATADAARTSVAVFAVSKHRRTRKATSWANAQVALGAEPAPVIRRRHITQPVFLGSYGFGGSSYGSSFDPPLTIVLSKR